MAISDNIKMMKIKIKKPSKLFIVIFLAIIFFFATSSFNYVSQDKDYVKWTSPDETANYFFAERLSSLGELSYFDSAAVVGDNMVMPRSLRSDAGWIKPVSFLGIILLYGSIASLLGAAVIPFLTPFFAALGIVIFYLLIKKIFNDRVALLSAFLLASFPVYVYYTVRSMFHNVLFVVLLLVGIYFLCLVLSKKEKKMKFLSFKMKQVDWLQLLFAFLGGTFIGLSIITRTSELLWLAPALGLTWLFYVRRLGFTKLILSLAGLAMALLPVVYWNQTLYASPTYGGYNEMNRSLDDISQNSGDLLKSMLHGDFSGYAFYIDSLKANIFYFGFKSEQSIEMFQHYVIEMFPILFYVSLLGLILLVGQNVFKFEKKYLLYILVWILLGVILVFYYGSWKFNDNPDPNRFTIGNSYTRYWLPIYLMMMPLVSLAIIRFSRAVLLIDRKAKNKIKNTIVNGLQATAILLISYFSIMFVLFGSEEGLVYLYYNNRMERSMTEKVFELTEPEAIIITRYHDKFFFPERRVIMGILPNNEILTTTAKLLRYYPVYYYNFYLDEKDTTYLNDRKLPEFGLQIELLERFNTNFGLYEITIKKNEQEE